MGKKVQGGPFDNGQASDGMTKDVKNRGKQENVCQSVRCSVRKRANTVNVSKYSIHRILRKDLRLYPNKLQELQLTDATEGLNFANEIIQRFRSFNNV
ncbi:hypothetical protein Trydic_g16081 [Trypoxylus dichotomus]